MKIHGGLRLSLKLCFGSMEPSGLKVGKGRVKSLLSLTFESGELRTLFYQAHSVEIVSPEFVFFDTDERI